VTVCVNVNTCADMCVCVCVNRRVTVSKLAVMLCLDDVFVLLAGLAYDVITVMSLLLQLFTVKNELDKNQLLVNFN